MQATLDPSPRAPTGRRCQAASSCIALIGRALANSPNYTMDEDTRSLEGSANFEGERGNHQPRRREQPETRNRHVPPRYDDKVQVGLPSQHVDGPLGVDSRRNVSGIEGEISVQNPFAVKALYDWTAINVEIPYGNTLKSRLRLLLISLETAAHGAHEDVLALLDGAMERDRRCISGCAACPSSHGGSPELTSTLTQGRLSPSRRPDSRSVHSHADALDLLLLTPTASIHGYACLPR